MGSAFTKFVRLCKLARIPHEYWKDRRWRHAEPRYLKSLTPYNEGDYVRLEEAAQRRWLDRLSQNPQLLHEPNFLAFLGDFSPRLAERVAFGLLCEALRDGLSVRAFPASAVNVPPPVELAKLNLDAPPAWQALCVYGAHTDDCAERRQALRDFLQYHDRALRLLVVHGRDPLFYLHNVLGVDPHAIFYLPMSRVRLFRLPQSET